MAANPLVSVTFLLFSSVLLAAVRSQVFPPPPPPSLPDAPSPLFTPPIIFAAPPPIVLAAPPISLPATDQFINQFYNDVVAKFTEKLILQLHDKAEQCIDDPNKDWNMAFNYTATDGSISNLRFLSNCMIQQGDAPSRFCTQTEISFYVQTLINQTTSGNTTYLKPNVNCNSTIYVSGCEPGWACALNPDAANQNNTSIIPPRTADCKPCCDGFFCPRGLSCMIPCPLGAYCRRATYDNSSGICVPYNYQLAAGRNLTCGGANAWGLIQNTKEIFCSEGSYCPTTIEQRSCSSGHYCRAGSIEQMRCSKLISCKEGTATQDIQFYGAMLIVGLIALLLIIYNCSDQIVTIRERRRAKSREKAARFVRISEQARSRWKFAIDASKKRANRLQTNLSQKFSSESNVEEIKILTNESSHSQASSLEIDSAESNNGNKSPKMKMPKLSGETQIFQHVYTQIEKEKSRQQHKGKLNLSRVISFATGSQVKKRPPIEVAFKEVTLTLKGKKKCLLQSLTGKIRPGRIAAVMGPSGAGKTTLLSALAGKATGCTRSGLILINGKDVSIHSYRKIVGFVPQDDIVHGNLTVEENLWFSARCRLSADLRKVDKLLILERVIESLGLHEVRDSLVGTVEKRGISGGQRKRVNVGLELVMEPSILFLDEPTSGLDSSSSRLLLQALRQEANAGVNIVMVVHQPSYTLFRMFDDLILLAKGGLMAYQGPVAKVEEYFEGIGIKVPERINPPDYYIDILEGMEDSSSTLNYRQLPLMWMIHNGYSVPEDMQSSAARLAMSVSNASDTDHDHSFAGEFWDNMNCNVQLRHDHIYHNFMRPKDLSNRRTPNIWFQYKYSLGRVCKQRLREASLQATDYVILLVAGACLGVISKISDADFALLCQVSSLRTFSNDKLQYWRESASGISSLAHFLAKDTIDHFNTALKPVVYLSMFYFFTNPRSSFSDNYIVLLSLIYCVTGMGYAFSIFFNPGPAQLFSVLVPVCLTLVSGQSIRRSTGPILKFIAKLSYPKWVLEAFVRCGVLMGAGFSLGAWKLCIMIIILFGVVSRLIAFTGMVALQKK
ncbi:hypothetical protein V2J09_008349 [Rumex salicifolius]